MIFSRWKTPQSFLFFTIRRISKKHWTQAKKKSSSTNRALEHFDDFYGSVFGDRWKVMRKALFMKQKYMALVNNYGDDEETKKLLKEIGAHNVRDVLNAQKSFNDSIGKFANWETEENTSETIESFTDQKSKSEIAELYGSGNSDGHIPSKLDVGETIINTKEEIEKTLQSVGSAEKLSLGTGLREADVDESRIIDAKLGMSAASLWTFVPTTKIKGMEDWMPESHYYNYYKSSKDFPINVEDDVELNFPEHLNVYSFEPGNRSTFPEPKRAKTGVLNYYLMDGASILPVLALDLKLNDRVLDLCAAPGGKSLVALQTYLPDIIICNDVSLHRVNRLYKVFREYIYDFDTNNQWKEKLIIHNVDGKLYQDSEGFDKVLVDVPCTTDRHSLKEDDNNIFNPMRVRERLQIPELQSDLLYNGLKLCRVGGCLVYSTCSLSPIQNDGVVHMALKKAWLDDGIRVTIKLMNRSLMHAMSLYNLGMGKTAAKYGTLITPHEHSNFGPMYFAKIIRIQ